MPVANRSAKEEYRQAHIPGAVFYDIDKHAAQSHLPHTLPSATEFAGFAGSLGIDENKTIEYNLPIEGDVSLLLFDAQGRLLKTIIDQGSKEAGLHRQAINLTGFSGGLFICLLKTETETLPLKLLKTQ